jgi:hypothetical protein
MAARKGDNRRSQAYALVLTTLFVACGASSSSPDAPEPGLAVSRAAQHEFRDLRNRFILASPAARAELAPAFERFIERHRDDPRGRVARLYLAWIYIRRGELGRARSLVDQTRGGPSGSARDFATMTEAAIAERDGDPGRALKLLQPLAGKIVDSDERAMYDELYVRAALAAKRWEQAARGMLDWLSQAPAEERAFVRGVIEHALDSLPAAALERALAASGNSATTSSSAERLAARDWLHGVVRDRLARLAIEHRDAALARRLLHDSAGARRRDSDSALSKLAAGSTVLPRVAGRAIGLALSLGTPEAQRRSAQVAMGMSRALGLHASASDDAVRLVIRDDAGDPDTFERTLAELAGDGAVILVAGVDARSVAHAAFYADRARLPVVLLGTPAVAPRKGSYAFRLGADPALEISTLRAGVAERGKAAPVHIGPGGLACDAGSSVAGQSRFPVQKWKADGIDTLLLLGDSACSREAIGELAAAGVRPLLAFGFESAKLLGTLPAVQPMLSIAAGSFPYRARSAPAAMRRWAETSGAGPDWYEALGHDVARLASAALEAFPLERVEDAAAVARLHRQARSRLLAATAELWTSERRGFEGSQRLGRRLELVADPAR